MTKHNKRVFLDSGHGKHDSGATHNGVKEKNVALQIALYTQCELERLGYSVRQSRVDDSYPTLSRRCRDCSDFDADIFVSIHLNAFNQEANGIETLHYPRSKNGKRLSQAIQNSIMQQFPTHKNRGLKPRGNLHVLRNTHCPASLVECEFIDVFPNWLNKPLVQKLYASAIAKGINSYFQD